MARSRAGLAGAAALVLVAAGGAVAVLAGGDDDVPDCAVTSTREDPRVPELVPREELLPRGTVRRDRGPVVRAFEDLATPFGPVEAGRFLERGDAAPSLVALGDRLGLVERTRLRVVDLPSGEVAWSVRTSAPIASGGLVGDDVALLLAGPSPALLTLDGDDGTTRACREVPVAGTADTPVTALLTDQAGSDVVVLAGRPAAPLTLSRLGVTPDADDAWTEEVGPGETGALEVAADLVLLSRVADPVRLAETAVAGGITTPQVTAYDVGSGEERWSHRPGPDTATQVVGADPDAGLVLVLEVDAAGTRQATRTRAALVALDGTGAEVWRRPLGRGLASGRLWSGHVVVQGPGPRGGARLRAYDLDGRPAWSLATPDLPFGEERDNFGPPTVVGDTTLVPAPNGLVDVDEQTGEARPLLLREPLDALLAVGDHLVVRSGPALLVMAREST